MRRSRITALLLIAGALLANAAFAGLGAVFNYPDILQAPAEQIMRDFRAREAAIIIWFSLLALAAALLAPIAVMVDRLDGIRKLSPIALVGISAALVQVIGLSRWMLIVPSLAAPEDIQTFERLHTILGTMIGETLGYALTALWTTLVVRRMGRQLAALWFSWIGYVSAGLVFLGVLVPLGVPGTDLANFVGYVLWSIWLIAFGFILYRRPART